jgi:uncharacterized protein (DUF4415 family)
MPALATVAGLREDEIDLRHTPEVKDWPGAVRGKFYRPVKQQLTLRLDADVIAWFREHIGEGEGYQTAINQALRAYVIARERKAG